MHASEAAVDLLREGFDFAIRHGGGQWPGVVAEHLFDEDYFAVCSPRLAGGRLPARPADLARYVLLRGTDEPWQPWFRAAGLDWPEPTRGPLFNDSSHMMQAAAEGQGIALTRQSLLGNDLRTGVLVRLFDVSVPSPSGSWLVHAPRLSGTPKYALFAAWLKRQIADDDMLRTRLPGVPGASAAASVGTGRRTRAGHRRRPREASND